MPDLEFDSYEDHIESIIFDLKIKKDTWYLIFTYKNPKTSNKLFINKLKVAYQGLCNKGKEIVILGDLNIDLHDPENDLDVNLCHIYNLQNLITDSTCFKKQEGTLIDPILVKNPRTFKGSINVYCSFSDWHHMMGCITKVQLSTFNPLRVTYRNYKKFDENAFKEDISQIPFQVCRISDDISDQYWAQKVLLTEVLNQHAP